MLVKVSIENFKSFDCATELTMISSNKIRTNASHRLKIKSTQLLKYGVVYGANAAGKTNLVEFFRFFKECVSKGIPLEAGYLYLRRSLKKAKSPPNLFTSRICTHYAYTIFLMTLFIFNLWLLPSPCLKSLSIRLRIIKRF